ncbi:MAG: UDP-glucose dehydrogenase family protein [Actinomycetota bacterium]
MRIGVIGTGHVGLITCASFASLGHDVVGADADQAKIDLLRSGEAPFYEPNVAEYLDRYTAQGNLTFTSDGTEAIAGADIVFICVGTPSRASGEANLVAVEQAARQVARAATGPLVVVEKSTVPAGTADRIIRIIALERPDLVSSIDVVSNPEFLREGHALEDALHPDRVLMGAGSPRAFAKMRALYQPLLDRGVPLIETDIRTAELAKHACNAFLALKISYANALARLCERAGADVEAVTEVMGADARIGREFLGAGLGYGGYCFPKDLIAFEHLADKLGYRFGLLGEVRHINEEAVEAAVEKVREATWNLEGKRIALLGLAFKAETDDVRFSPAVSLARRLIQEGAQVVGTDPYAGANAQAECPEMDLADDPYQAAEGADCLVLATAWPEYQELNWVKLGRLAAAPLLVDGRNALDRDVVVAAGFSYYSMGRRASTPAGEGAHA